MSEMSKLISTFNNQIQNKQLKISSDNNRLQHTTEKINTISNSVTGEVDWQVILTFKLNGGNIDDWSDRYILIQEADIPRFRSEERVMHQLSRKVKCAKNSSNEFIVKLDVKEPKVYKGIVILILPQTEEYFATAFRFKVNTSRNIQEPTCIDASRAINTPPHYGSETPHLPYITSLIPTGRTELKAHESKELYGKSANLKLANYCEVFRKCNASAMKLHEKQHMTYSINEIALEKLESGCYRLKVENLSEKRPRLIVGSIILLQRNHYLSEKQTPFYAQVVEIEKDRTHVRFVSDVSFKWKATYTFAVNFPVDMTPYIRVFATINYFQTKNNNTEALRMFLFPSAKFSQKPVCEPSEFHGATIQCFSQNIESNEPQKRAVESIIKYRRNYPFVLFGPPGTGKTHTLSEAICWLLVNGGKRIIVCCATNSAADNIYERIMSILKFKNQNEHNNLPVYMRFKSLFRCKQDGLDYFEQEQQILHNSENVRLVVCTSSTAFTLFDTLSFDYLFMDEAGSTQETESLQAMIGCNTTLNKGLQIVLAGDPKQLGPFSFNHPSCSALSSSLLQRICGYSEYRKDKDDKYNPEFIVKLLLNFRSHPAILKPPSDLFYDRELVSRANAAEVNLFATWEYLPNPEQPILFIPVRDAQESQEGNSHSFSNYQEVGRTRDVLIQVRKFIKSTGFASNRKVTVGIITPYIKQKQKIEKVLANANVATWEELDVSVGSVEFFQGQEKDVIIISTVRSFPEDEEFVKHNIGFLRCQKRLNVAITRAKSLLIVIGNDIKLSDSPIWSKFIRYCGSCGIDREVAQPVARKPDKIMCSDFLVDPIFKPDK